MRLEISERADEGFLAQLQTASALDLEERDVYKVAGPVDLTALAALWTGSKDSASSRSLPSSPRCPPVMANRENVFICDPRARHPGPPSL